MSITTSGSWHRTGRTIVLIDPFAPAPPQREGGGGSGGPRKRPTPSSAQLDLLRQFFGSGIPGAQARLANFQIPPGLKARTLRWYAGIARRALADPAKATPHAKILQPLRLQLVQLALAKIP
jgi:hypothetical protein